MQQSSSLISNINYALAQNVQKASAFMLALPSVITLLLIISQSLASRVEFLTCLVRLCCVAALRSGTYEFLVSATFILD